MSLYVQWINQIKVGAKNDWLTDGQRYAYDHLVGQWHGSPFVCLHGASGCGKSFIARLLSAEQGYVYAQNLETVQPGKQQVVLDGEEYTRLLRSASMLRRIQRVILVSRRPPRDPMPQIEVVLSERDRKQFQHNLTKHKVLDAFLTESKGTNFADILRDEAVARGNLYGAE